MNENSYIESTTDSDALRYKAEVYISDINSSHTQIVNFVPSGSKVLDVGCACGDLGNYLFHKKQCELWGIEYSPESIKVALATKAYVEIIQADLNNFQGFKEDKTVFFDCIIFGDVLEHLYNPERVLELLKPLLKEGGSIIISLPNVAHGSIITQMIANEFTYMEHGILDRTHLYFFTYKSIAKFLAEAKLKITNSTKTIWDLPGLHPYSPAKMVSHAVLQDIASNPHAFVLQYVMLLKSSNESQKMLQKNNLSLLNDFSNDEMTRIASYQSGLSLDTANPSPETLEHTPANSISLRVALRYRMAYIKSVLKKIMPRFLWDFLKSCRNKLRKTHTQIQTSLVDQEQLLTLYKEQVLSQASNKNLPCFVDFREKKAQVPQKCPKTIAFYLTQFAPCKQNDEWWGRGFTEWTNVTKTVPLFIGHHQPQLPIDLGFYDLRVPEVMERQIELAKHYGVEAFCFYYYWFSGTRMLERPLFNFLNEKSLDFPFCLCWANEPWSRRWDGSEDDLLIGQNLTDDDDQKFMEDIFPFISDPRYIKVDGKPLLIIYRPHFWSKERVHTLLDNFRSYAKEAGLNGLYMAMALTHNFFENPEDWGFDAGVEFPPHMCGGVPRADVQLVNENFCGSIHDVRELVNEKANMGPSEYVTLKTVFPAWDNTARKNDNALIFHHTEPDVYKTWLKNALTYTRDNNPANAQYVFINAWNEWAEGAHLEPDRKYGYAFLQATAEALEEFK